MNLDNVFKGLSVSASGLMAERVRMGLIATNIAHSHDTNIGDGSAYKRKIPVFETILEGEMAGGVSVRSIVHDHETAHLEKHMPGHPDANAQGMVTLPNVNPTFEMVDLMTSSRAYEANLQAMNKAVQMAEQALELGR